MRQTDKIRRLGHAVREEIQRSEGVDGGDLDSNRRKAMEAYWAQARGDEIPGRSQYVSADVAGMTNAVSAQLTPMLTTDASVTFKANGAEDAKTADAESQAVSEQIMEHNEGFLAIQEAVRDALIARNGALKVDVVEDVQTQTIDVPEALTDVEIAFLTEPAAMNEERELNLETRRLKITRTNISYTFEACPIENMMWRANWPSRDLEKIPFIAQRVFYTRSDLIEMGISKKLVAGLPSIDAETWNNRSRNRDSQFTFEAATPDQDTIECFWAYILIDQDGDGISERHRVLLAGENTVLMDDEVPWVPYAIGSCYITAHRLTGESLFDHMRQIQDAKTWVSRHMFDSIAMANNPRPVVHEHQANMDDVLNNDFGSPIRVRNMDAVREFYLHQHDPAGPMQALQYLDERRTEAGGAALDQLGANLQIAGETAHGVERQYGSKELMVALFAANFAETCLKRAFLLMHATMRLNANEPLEMEIADEWVEVDPRTWPERKRAKVTAGMSVGQRMHIQQVLAQGIQLHMGAQQAGKQGILSDDSTLYRTIARWYQLAGVEDPEAYWVDPSSPAAQEAGQAMQQQMQAEQQAQMQQMQETFAAQMQLEMDKLAADMQKHREELEFKYSEAALKAETEEAKIVGSATLELEKQQNEMRAGSSAARDGKDAA